MDSSDGLNVGDVTGPRWAGGTRNPSSMDSSNAEKAAQQFHEAYERLAPQFGYKTREASAVPWADVPAQNKALMIAVAGEVLASRDADVTEALNVGHVVGHASRDAEVEVLREQLAAAEARAVHAELEWAAADARTVLAEAVIEKVRVLVNEPGGFFYRDVIEALNVAPSSVLAVHDREVAARALEEFRGDLITDTHPGNVTVMRMRDLHAWLTERAAALRSGTEGSTDA